MTKREVVRAMIRAGIAGQIQGVGLQWEVELPEEKVTAFQERVADVGGYKTGHGTWVLRPGYEGSGDYES